MPELVLDETLQDQRRSTPRPDAPAAPQLFLAIECARPLAGGARHSLLHIDEVVIGRGSDRESRRVIENGVRRLIVNVRDPRMSARHVRLHRVGTTWHLEDLGSTNGTRLDGAEVSLAVLSDAALLELGHTFFIFRDGLPVPATAAGDVDASDVGPLVQTPAFATLIPELAAAFGTLATIANSTVPTLLLGETGSGKELLARAIHERSRRSGDFVAINCGAIPETLIEAQLFGHARGAFSGAARDELGYVRSADKGTLFLDEIAELPHSSQTALLRVLQEQEVVPVGSARPIAVDIRVIAATHAPIDDLVARGAFRNDLFARLAGFRFTAPPLRERIEDLGLFIATLLAELGPAAKSAWTIEPAAARALLTYDWPRNIRELEQCLGAAAVLGDYHSIELAHLTHALGQPHPAISRRSSRPASRIAPARRDDVADAADAELHRELLAAFSACKGNVSEVARSMGKARVQIQRWMKRFAIDPAAFR